jgi:uncharacterized SAM-binding protein YcdF (DUF218 family)
MNRDYTQLPSLSELRQILAAEAQRNLPSGKKSEHFVDFGSIRELIEQLGLSAPWLDKDLDPESLSESDIDEVESLIRNVVQRILESDKSQLRPALDKVYDYLSEEDAPVQSDLIFVFGSASNFRIDKAIELFNRGLAKTIMISGRGPYYENSDSAEADKLAARAMESGVPESALIKERESITVPDNVKRSLNLLERDGVRHDSIILVNSPFAQRRGWAHFRKLSNSAVYRVNSESSPKYQKDHWFEQEETIKVVVNEFVKMKIALILNTV